MEFSAGIRVCFDASTGDANPLKRVFLSAGTEPVRDELLPEEQRGYYPADARLPRRPWRNPSPREAFKLLATPGENAIDDTVWVVRPKLSARELVRDLLDDSGRLRSDATAVVETVRAAVAPFLDEGTALGDSLRVLPQGLSTVTWNAAAQQFIGLHVDNFSRTLLSARRETQNRICVNLGESPRTFYFVNRLISELAPALELDEETLLRSNPSDLGRLFMARHPSYPVVRLELRPGEAYIAPTENVIHDASTLGSPSLDVTLTFHGRFRAS